MLSRPNGVAAILCGVKEADGSRSTIERVLGLVLKQKSHESAVAVAVAVAVRGYSSELDSGARKFGFYTNKQSKNRVPEVR